MHPQFNKRLASNDIGLVTVEKKIRFTPFVQPIPLETKPILDRQQGVVEGWGISSQNRRRTIILQYLMVRIWDTRTCMRSHGMGRFRVTKNNVCTLNRKRQGICSGDSGGPLVANGRIIGIVSWGGRCAAGRPDVFTKVSAYVDWIHNNTGHYEL